MIILTDIKCEKCGIIEDFLDNSIQLGGKCVCPTCGGEAIRFVNTGHTYAGDCGEHIRLSSALAVHPDLIADGTAQKMHPGANFVKSKGGMYQLEIRSRSDKLKRMRERSAYTGKTLHEAD